VFKNPLHPYTQGLLQCIPDMDEEKDELYVIKGSVPSPDDMPDGCRFVDRCPYAQEMCLHQIPPLVHRSENHEVHCWKYTDQWVKKREGELIAKVNERKIAVSKSS
jgi:oligopeptide/dipeptide ABC transporter ATP-binding protein